MEQNLISWQQSLRKSSNNGGNLNSQHLLQGQRMKLKLPSAFMVTKFKKKWRRTFFTTQQLGKCFKQDMQKLGGENLVVAIVPLR